MSHTLITTPATILLVEDNPGDIVLAREAFKKGCLQNRLDIVKDGEEAMLYLRKAGAYQQAETPHIILLDLNLPIKDGCEVLNEIKTDPRLMFIPVIVFTTSSSANDIMRAYCSRANCFITKPSDFDQFTCVIRSIENFWLRTARLPVQSKIYA